MSCPNLYRGAPAHLLTGHTPRQSRSPELTQAVASERSRMAAKLYLVAYNTAQFLGWTYLAYQMAAHLAGGGTLDTLYAATATTLQIFQVMPVVGVDRGRGLVTLLGVSGLINSEPGYRPGPCWRSCTPGWAWSGPACRSQCSKSGPGESSTGSIYS